MAMGEPKGGGGGEGLKKIDTRIKLGPGGMLLLDGEIAP